MTRKRNFFGFRPKFAPKEEWRPSVFDRSAKAKRQREHLAAKKRKKELARSREEFQERVREKRRLLKEQHREQQQRKREQESQLRSEYKRLRKSARGGRTGGTRRLESLFHEVYGPGGMMQNPRELPGLKSAQLAAIENLIKGNATMAKKQKSKKKRNSRKGKMPAGLKAYWARKRAAKAKRKNPRRRRRTNPKVRVRTRTIIKYRTRTVKVKVRPRRRKINPRRATVRRIVAPSGLSPKGLQQFRRTVAKLTGKRTRIVSK